MGYAAKRLQSQSTYHKGRMLGFLSTVTFLFNLNVSERKHEKGTDNDVLLQQPKRAVPLTTNDSI